MAVQHLGKKESESIGHWPALLGPWMPWLDLLVTDTNLELRTQYTVQYTVHHSTPTVFLYLADLAVVSPPGQWAVLWHTDDGAMSYDRRSGNSCHYEACH